MGGPGSAWGLWAPKARFSQPSANQKPDADRFLPASGFPDRGFTARGPPRGRGLFGGQGVGRSTGKNRRVLAET